MLALPYLPVQAFIVVLFASSSLTKYSGSKLFDKTLKQPCNYDEVSNLCM